MSIIKHLKETTTTLFNSSEHPSTVLFLLDGSPESVLFLKNKTRIHITGREKIARRLKMTKRKVASNN